MLNTVNDRLIVSIDTTSEKYAARVAGSDLPFLSRNGNIISSEVTRSGAEQAHDALYARDGSRKLTGTMDADGNNIQGAGNIGAGNIDTGSLTATGLIASGSLKVTGDANVDGTLKASAIKDTDDLTGQRILKLSGDSIIGGLTTEGLTKVKGKLMLDNNFNYANKVGDGCEEKTLTLDSEGNLLTCKNGFWAKTSGGEGGNEVITGTVTDGQLIPLPNGYAVNQCRFSLSAQNLLSKFDASGTKWVNTDVKVNMNGAQAPTASCNFYIGGAGGDIADTCTYTTVCNKDITKLVGTVVPSGGQTDSTVIVPATTSKTINKDTGGAICNSVTSSTGNYTYTQTGLCNGNSQCLANNGDTKQVPTNSFPSYSDKGTYFNLSCSGSDSNGLCTFTLACIMK